MEGDVGEGGDEAEELGEYVGRLLEVLYVDLGVDFLFSVLRERVW